MRGQIVENAETLLERPTRSNAVEAAKDRLSAVLTELAAPPARAGLLSRSKLAKKGTDKGAPGTRRKREFDDRPPGKAPSPQGGNPGRKGMSHSRETKGRAVGKRRSRELGFDKGAASGKKPGAGRSGGKRTWKTWVRKGSQRHPETSGIPAYWTHASESEKREIVAGLYEAGHVEAAQFFEGLLHESPLFFGAAVASGMHRRPRGRGKGKRKAAGPRYTLTRKSERERREQEAAVKKGSVFSKVKKALGFSENLDESAAQLYDELMNAESALSGMQSKLARERKETFPRGFIPGSVTVDRSGIRAFYKKAYARESINEMANPRRTRSVLLSVADDLDKLEKRLRQVGRTLS